MEDAKRSVGSLSDLCSSGKPTPRDVKVGREQPWAGQRQLANSSMTLCTVLVYLDLKSVKINMTFSVTYYLHVPT